MEVDYGKPREAGLCHSKDDGAQRFFRMSNHWFSQNIPQRNRRRARTNEFVQFFACDYTLEVSF